MQRDVTLLSLVLILLLSSPALAWNDATHMAVMKAAGLGDYAYLAVGADMAKEKSGGHEEGNHYCNKKKGAVVTADMVLDQVRDYNCRCFAGEGHLYGAIVAALDKYYDRKKNDKYDRYALGFAAHYIADLSMPLHNIDYDEYNRTNHAANDGAVETEPSRPTEQRVATIAANIKRFMDRIPSYRLPPVREGLGRFNYEVAKKVAEIANKSILLGYSMRDATPQRKQMTTDEAYRQLAESALLLKAAFAALK